MGLGQGEVDIGGYGGRLNLLGIAHLNAFTLGRENMKKISLAFIALILAFILWGAIGKGEPTQAPSPEPLLASPCEVVQLAPIKEISIPGGIIEEPRIRLSAPYDFIPLEDELQIYMEERCAEMNLSFFFCAALMQSESSFNKEAVSADGYDIGLFQIREPVWADVFKGYDLRDPYDNIDCGLTIISNLFEKYEDVCVVLQCYKCGETKGLRLMEEGYYLPSIPDILYQQEEWEKLWEEQ